MFLHLHPSFYLGTLSKQMIQTYSQLVVQTTYRLWYGRKLSPFPEATNDDQSPAPTARLLQHDTKHWRALIAPKKNIWASSDKFLDTPEMVCFLGPGSDAPVVKKKDMPKESDLDPLLLQNPEVAWEVTFHTEWRKIFHWRTSAWIYQTIDWDTKPPYPLQIIASNDYTVTVKHPRGLPRDASIVRYDPGPGAPDLFEPHGMQRLHQFGDRWYFAPELDPYYVPKHLWGLGIYEQHADGTPKTCN
jgi:hypothetical protein